MSDYKANNAREVAAPVSAAASSTTSSDVSSSGFWKAGRKPLLGAVILGTVLVAGYYIGDLMAATVSSKAHVEDGDDQHSREVEVEKESLKEEVSTSVIDSDNDEDELCDDASDIEELEETKFEEEESEHGSDEEVDDDSTLKLRSLLEKPTLAKGKSVQMRIEEWPNKTRIGFTKQFDKGSMSKAMAAPHSAIDDLKLNEVKDAAMHANGDEGLVAAVNCLQGCVQVTFHTKATANDDDHNCEDDLFVFVDASHSCPIFEKQTYSVDCYSDDAQFEICFFQ